MLSNILGTNKNTDPAQQVCFHILQEQNGKGRQEKFTTCLLP